MQTEAEQAAKHLQNAAALRKIASEMRDSDPETAEKLVQVAEDYERLAVKLMAMSALIATPPNSN
jgi:hypothetical protein